MRLSPTSADGVRKFWSEAHVSEDFDCALRFQVMLLLLLDLEHCCSMALVSSSERSLLAVDACGSCMLLLLKHSEAQLKPLRCVSTLLSIGGHATQQRCSLISCPAMRRTSPMSDLPEACCLR